VVVAWPVRGNEPSNHVGCALGYRDRTIRDLHRRDAIRSQGWVWVSPPQDTARRSRGGYPRWNPGYLAPAERLDLRIRDCQVSNLWSRNCEVGWFRGGACEVGDLDRSNGSVCELGCRDCPIHESRRCDNTRGQFRSRDRTV